MRLEQQGASPAAKRIAEASPGSGNPRHGRTGTLILPTSPIHFLCAFLLVIDTEGYDTSNQIRPRLIREGIEPHPGPGTGSRDAGRKQTLRIGLVNIKGMHQFNKEGTTKKLDMMSSRNLHSKGWLEAHDAVVLVDTKNLDPKFTTYENHTEIHRTAHPDTHRQGVTIILSSGLKYENESSLEWELPASIKHRMLAIRVSAPMGHTLREQNFPAAIYGENNAQARVFFWIMGVYAPTTNCHVEFLSGYDENNSE